MSEYVQQITELLGKLDKTQIDELLKILKFSYGVKPMKYIPGRYTEISFWKYDESSAVGEKFDFSVDYFRRMGVCSETKEEAEFVYRQQKAYLELIDKIFELNDGWVPAWGANISNYAFSYYHPGKGIDSYDWENIQYFKTELYFKSEDIGNRIIEELGTELIKLALWGLE